MINSTHICFQYKSCRDHRDRQMSVLISLSVSPRYRMKCRIEYNQCVCVWWAKASMVREDLLNPEKLHIRSKLMNFNSHCTSLILSAYSLRSYQQSTAHSTVHAHTHTHTQVYWTWYGGKGCCAGCVDSTTNTYAPLAEEIEGGRMQHTPFR